MTELAPHLITRGRPRPVTEGLTLAQGLTLAPGRVHEICGTARRMLALKVAARATGPVFWIAPAWEVARPNPCGLPDGLDPGRLIHVSPERTDDVLWAMEETLRAGAAPLAIADLPHPPGLVAVRRMHLAAETGNAATGLILTPEGAAPGIESRWSLAPAHRGDTDGWRLGRLRDRTRPPATWHMDGASALA